MRVLCPKRSTSPTLQASTMIDAEVEHHRQASSQGADNMSELVLKLPPNGTRVLRKVAARSNPVQKDSRHALEAKIMNSSP